MDQIAPTAVALKNVARRFVTPAGEILSALEDFDLSIAPGEFFAIVGPTGCGKSTTLGLIAGLAKPQAGEVTLFDAPVEGVDRRVGFVFQQDAVFPWRNVLGNVMAGPLFRGVPKAKAEEMARDWINRVGLTGFEDHHPHQLSGGMRKRVALARSIAMDPQCILYDEPTTGLDPVTAGTINDLIRSMQARLSVTTVVVTHDIQSAFFVGDRIAYLFEGRMEFVGSVEEARESREPRLRHFLSGGREGSVATV